MSFQVVEWDNKSCPRRIMEIIVSKQEIMEAKKYSKEATQRII